MMEFLFMAARPFNMALVPARDKNAAVAGKAIFCGGKRSDGEKQLKLCVETSQKWTNDGRDGAIIAKQAIA